MVFLTPGNFPRSVMCRNRVADGLVEVFVWKMNNGEIMKQFFQSRSLKFSFQTSQKNCCAMISKKSVIEAPKFYDFTNRPLSLLSKKSINSISS